MLLHTALFNICAAAEDDDEDGCYTMQMILRITITTHLSTNGRRGINNDHSERGDQGQVELLGKPSTITSNALQISTYTLYIRDDIDVELWG